MIGRHRKKNSTDVNENWMSYISEREALIHQGFDAYERLFKNAPIGLINIDQEGIITDCNDCFVDRVGLPKQKICGLNIQKIPNREMAMAVKDAMKGHLTAFKGEYELISTRKRLYLEVQFAPNYTENKTITGVIGVVQDASDQQLRLSEALHRSEERSRFITENMVDLVAQLNPQGIFEYVSPSHTQVTGWETGQIVGACVFNNIHPEDSERFQSMFFSILNSKTERQGTYRLRCRDNGFIWLEILGKPLLDEDEKPIGILSASRNIEERMQHEEKLRYITEHDPLTGLYNRIYFEKDLQIIDDQGQYPMAIIIADVDGLKLVNDTLGISVGDKFLLDCSQLLLAVNLKDAQIYRIGGDEFAILLAGYKQHQVDGVYQQLKSAIDHFNVGNNSIPLSISMGYAVRNDPFISMAEVVKEADQNMCRQKLFHQQSGRSAIVDIIMKTLAERDLITEGHTSRMQDLVILLADECGFNDYQKQALSLLARFHDIGKVGIPDHILFKPGKLSDTEYEEMKKHSEIGFRIARTAADLSYIAEWILKHHERWDGKGYPIGLKAEEIPLECRMLAIVDAYDAMINDRPYRKALSKEYAIEELLRGAGTQFDPAMVKVFLQVLQGVEHESNCAV